MLGRFSLCCSVRGCVRERGRGTHGGRLGARAGARRVALLADRPSHRKGTASVPMRQCLFEEREPGTRERGRAMIGPQEVIYSCKASALSGFTYYALCVYRPRSTRAQAVVALWRADSHFPRQVHTRDFLNFALRGGRPCTSGRSQAIYGRTICTGVARRRRSQLSEIISPTPVAATRSRYRLWVRLYRSPLPTAPPVQPQGADFFAVT